MRFLYQTLAVAWRYLAVGLTVLVLVVGVFVFRFYHRPQQAYIVHQETLAGREINFPCFQEIPEEYYDREGKVVFATSTEWLHCYRYRPSKQNARQVFIMNGEQLLEVFYLDEVAPPKQDDSILKIVYLPGLHQTTTLFSYSMGRGERNCVRTETPFPWKGGYLEVSSNYCGKTEQDAVKAWEKFVQPMFKYMSFGGEVEPENVLVDTQSLTVRSKKIDYKAGIEIKAEYPEISYEGDKGVEKKINLQIKKFIDEVYWKFVEDQQEFQKRYANTDGLPDYFPAGSNSLWIEHTVSKNERIPNILSVMIMGGQYTVGGPMHPQYMIKTFNSDLATGRNITLSELFKAGSDYDSVLASSSVKYLQESIGIFKSYGPSFSAKRNNFEHFMIKDDGLFVQFEYYQLGGGRPAGQPAITIPYEDVREYIKPNGYLAPILN